MYLESVDTVTNFLIFLITKISLRSEFPQIRPLDIKKVPLLRPPNFKKGEFLRPHIFGLKHLISLYNWSCY